MSYESYDICHYFPQGKIIVRINHILCGIISRMDTFSQMDTFGQWLLENLEIKGWSQSELARRCRVKPSTVSKWISGENKPSPENIVDMAPLLGVTPEEIFRRVWLPASMATRLETRELLEYVEGLTREERAELLRYAKYLYQQGER